MSNGHGGPPASNGPAVAALVRREKTLQLKVAGAANRTIAEQLGCSEVQVRRDLKRVLGELADQNRGAADKLRALMMERYNRLLLAVWPRAIGGDGEAIGIVLSILGHVRAINGLDPKVPINVDARTLNLNGPVGIRVVYAEETQSVTGATVIDGKALPAPGADGHFLDFDSENP